MRYTAPVNAPDEVESLVSAGADELYCGFQDAWWVERYGDHDSASRRQGRANFSSLDDLSRAVEAARTYDVPLYLALNSRYTEPQLDRLEGLCDEFADRGGTGIIASDLGLLWRLRDHRFLTRTLSLLAVAQNVPTLSAFARLGVTRVVLPRFIEPDAAHDLLAAVPDVQGEVMAFFDKCPLVDGYCRHRHGVSYPDRELSGNIDDAAPLYVFDTTYRTHKCLGEHCAYLEPYPCGACFLRQFEESGVGFAKLGGRGRPLEERLRALRFLREAELLHGDGERADLYRRTFCTSCSCYYGASTQKRSAIEPVELPDSLSDQTWTVVGSQTNHAAFKQAFDEIRSEVHPAYCKRLALLVPPLSDTELASVLDGLPAFAAHCSNGARLIVNDLGTYLETLRALRPLGPEFTVEAGTLLSRCDDPEETAHFLSFDENPPRPVWGPEGEPRVLMYRKPPMPLQEHWRRPSLFEPSAQAALHSLACIDG